MGLIVSMSLAGGSAMLLYYIMRFLFRDKWSAQGRERMLKLSLFFFLCPFQKVKYLFPTPVYRLIMEYLPGAFGDWSTNKISYYDWSDYVLLPWASDRYVVLAPWKAVTAAAAFLFALLFVLYQMRRYFRLKRLLQRCSADVTEELAGGFAGQPELQKLWKEKTRFLRSPAVKSPFTIGFLRPLVFLPEMDFTAEELEMVCCHELVHGRRRDAVIKGICLLAVLLHWFNPFSYLLLLEYGRVCELRCDQMVLEQLGREKGSTYAKLVIRSAAWEGQGAGLWTSGYAGKGKDIEERVRRILDMDGKRRRSITAAAVLLAVLCSSVTVYAYRMEETVDKGVADLDWTIMTFDDTADESYLVPAEDGGFVRIEEPIVDFSRSDSAFIADDTGEVTFLNEAVSGVYAVCVHNYVTGRIVDHEKDGKGGCTVKIYEGKKCTKCNQVVREKLVSTVTYDPCPH